MPKDDRIRAVQFLNSCVRSGAEEVALEMARGLDPDRFESHLVCPQALLDAFGNDGQVEGMHALPLTLVSPWHLSAARRFVAYLRSRKIDVVHAHMIRAALAAIPLARVVGVPVVVHTCHGREAWRKGLLSRRYWADRLIDRWVDATVAVSESTRTYLVEEKKLDPRKVVVIRNGRNLDAFSRDSVREQQVRTSLGIDSKQLVIIVLGRLEAQKGHRYLIEALPPVCEAHPSLKVLFVGDGSLRRELEMQVLARQLEHRVVFTGYRRDWADILAISDVVALPSLYEGMPLVAIEAAVFAKPVVATAVDGTCEVVIDGSTGRLVPPAQPEPLARALIQLLSDPEERRRLGNNACVRARRQFSRERQLRETADLYQKLLTAKTGSEKADRSFPSTVASVCVSPGGVPSDSPNSSV